MSSPESYLSEERARSYYQEQEKLREEKALAHLVESGRAENRDAAERHLAALNAIKEKLIHFVREELSSRTKLYSSSYDPLIQYGDKTASSGDLGEITLDDLDRKESELWNLERAVDSSTYLGARDRLQIRFSKGTVKVFPDFAGMGGGTFERLQEYLTKEDLEFVMKEYSFAVKDLEKRLRAQADSLARKPRPAYGWRNFSPAKEKEGPLPARPLHDAR